jgi:hypothetical protein
LAPGVRDVRLFAFELINSENWFPLFQIML